MAKAEKLELRFQQIVVAQWKDTYSLVGLSTGGQVYRYKQPDAGWVRLGMFKIDDEGKDQE